MNSKRWLTPVLLTLALLLGIKQIHGQDIWVGYQQSSTISRFNSAGSLLGTFTAPTPVDTIATVGNEVWLGWEQTPNIFRYSPNGTFLGGFSVPTPVSVLTQVGNEVWAGFISGSSYRMNLSGSLLGFLPFSVVTTYELVGNEVWASGEGSAQFLHVSLAGSLLGASPTPIPLSAMQAIGNEVWVGWQGSGQVLRYDKTTSGIVGGFGSPAVNALELVGNELWLGNQAGNSISRFSTTSPGTFLGSFGTPTPVSVITVVPEPGTVALFGLSLAVVVGAAHKRRRPKD